MPPSPHHSDGERAGPTRHVMNSPAARAAGDDPRTVEAEREGDGERVEEWPVVWLADAVGAKRLGFRERRERLQLCVTAPRQVSMPVETYLPASHPLVLSVEDARRIEEALTFAVESSEFKTKAADEEFRDKLASYGKEHHAD